MKRHEVFAKELTACLFAEMHNPRFRGPQFTWEGFPEMAGRHIKAQLPLYYAGDMPQWAPEKAHEVAVDFAKYLVELMTQ